MHQHIKCLFFSILVFMLMPLVTEASSQNCAQWLARIISMQGKVDTQFAGENLWQATAQDQTFCRGDKIRTARNSRVTLFLSNESRASLDQNTTLTFLSPKKVRPAWYLNLIQGAAFFRSRQPHQLDIHTPFINAVHQGTEFLVTVTGQHTEISVFDGQVAAHNQKGEIVIEKGYSGFASQNQKPHVQPLIIRPEDAVQWTLYYPPIIDDSAFHSVDMQASLQAYQQGNITQALVHLNNMSEAKQNTAFLALKSSLLLTVGRVDEVLTAINKMQMLDSSNSNAFALQSIIAVTKNKKGKALENAQKAAILNAESAVAQIALSYAYQANFNIEAAVKATQEAIRLSPNNALAWTRLSELQLSVGERDAALKSARKAIELNPKLARTHTILGFAYLAEVDIDQAKKSFIKAIALDSADPLARLGLALSKIRKGDVEQGTADLETAVSLAPDNAIMRSYLGKAYYELRNNGYAATELALAKEMDPNDPTPWFYDAIRKQTTNRPVEALHDMQKAIELNDNRGVYRSKFLLDEDAAARSANLSRIYQDLGFGRVALKHSWDALNLDSTNHSAHRFLSDSYIGQPRFRIARASELLQAQLLQPINITPVQPQLTAENIGILNSTGPGRLSSGEYDPLFTSNGAHVLLNGAYGSNNTLTDSAIISGVYDQLSLSLGQFHFQTDGFRNNDDYQQDIYNAFVQYAFSPDFSIQFEFKTDDVRNGDVPLRLNGINQEDLRQVIENDIARVGAHYRINNEQDLVISAFYTALKDNQSNVRFFSAPPGFIATRTRETETINKGYQTEIQYLYHPSFVDITIGAGYLELKKDTQMQFTNRLTIFGTAFPLPLEEPIIDQDKVRYFNSYLYLKHNILSSLTSTLGLSFDSYQDEIIERQQLNPKVGLTWSPFDNLSFRGATFRTLKRPLATNQTIEPTQVSGFNQFFDRTNGTTAWQYSLGIDYQPIEDIFVGGEVNWSYAKEFFIGNGEINSQKRKESSHLAYFYWTADKWLSFRAEYRFEKFNREFEVGNDNDFDPQSVSTQQIPLSINFFHDTGAFAKLNATYVSQRVGSITALGTPEISNDKEQFWTFDASLGYRLPKKFGLISVEVRNLFDNHFAYQSVFDASGTQLSPFVPEREIFVKLSFFY